MSKLSTRISIKHLQAKSSDSSRNIRAWTKRKNIRASAKNGLPSLAKNVSGAENVTEEADSDTLPKNKFSGSEEETWFGRSYTKKPSLRRSRSGTARDVEEMGQLRMAVF